MFLWAWRFRGLIGIALGTLALAGSAWAALAWHGRQVDQLVADATRAGELAERAIWADLVAQYKADRDAERQRAAATMADLGDRAAAAEQELGGLIHANERLLAEIAGRVGFVDWRFDSAIVRALNEFYRPPAAAGGD